ncbi:uncharacterized protein LOC111863333 [Cryptotermes secundus]|uniref:uncharacterized protein LOC111863333 n=1 Tax=Cryptotermes secundus TaxID=105785 RepID=UPI001454DE9B|nr:uncharacterized protein LOC111863333 [Cryptotermes secundus]
MELSIRELCDGEHHLFSPEEVLSNIKIEPDDSEPNLQEAVTESKNNIEKVVESVLERNWEGNMEGGSIVLHATAEFRRTLGDITTYGLAGNRDEYIQELLLSTISHINMATELGATLEPLRVGSLRRRSWETCLINFIERDLAERK